MFKYVVICGMLTALFFPAYGGNEDSSLVQLKVIEGKISPKSIVHSGKGVFFAQNMMYKHTITVYDRSFNLIKTISDKIKLKDYGYSDYQGTYRGSPVECAFSPNGKYAWVSNYNMSGGEEDEFVKPGCDDCCAKGVYDSSFVYKINTDNLEIEAVVKVGAVPKFVAITPNNKYLLVTNWSSGDMSVVDIQKEKEVKRIRVGTYPRGIAINKDGSKAYVAIMGSSKIAVVDLLNFTKTFIKDVGRSPRHLCMSPSGEELFATMNGEGRIAKISLLDNSIEKLKTGSLPRSMEISKDGKFLYVVNYGSDKLSKVDTKTMEVVATVETNDKPIGVTFDEDQKNVWVACYEGSLMVFHDKYYDNIDSSLVSLNEEDITLQKRENIDLSLSEERRENKKNLSVEKPVIESKMYFYIITGSFQKEGNADRKVEELIKDGYPAFTYFNPKNNFTYACANGFNDESKAMNALSKMKSKGEAVWLFKLKK